MGVFAIAQSAIAQIHAVPGSNKIKWEIFMRHSMLPMLIAANPDVDRRLVMAALLLA